MTTASAARPPTPELDAVTTLTDDELEEFLVSIGDDPVLLYFTTSWCGPCRTFGPELNRYVARHPGVLKVVRLDGDDSPAAAARFRIHAFPTLTLVRGGEQLWLHSGALTEQELVETLPALSAGARAVQPHPAQDAHDTVAEPSTPARGEARSTTVPSVDDPRVTVWLGRDRLAPGARVQLSPDEGLHVVLTSDPRRHPSCDLAILRQFDLDVVDSVQVSCSDLDTSHLAQLSAVRGLASLSLQSGKPLGSDVLAGLRSLSQLRVLHLDAPGTDLPAVRAQLPQAMVNFEWSAPQLAEHLAPASRGGDAPAALPPVRLAAPGRSTMILLADHPAQPATNDVRSALARVTTYACGEVVDADRPEVRDAFALGPTGELLLVHDGGVVARRDTCGPHHVQELLDLAGPIGDGFSTDAAAVAAVAGRITETRARVVALDLPAGEAHLVPPRATMADWVTLDSHDAGVDIPAGWSLLVRTGTADGALHALPSDEVDHLEVFLDEDTEPADIAELCRWPRLVELTVIMPSWSSEVLAALTHLGGLRRLLLAADAPQDVDAEGILRDALPDTIVNDEWNHPALAADDGTA